MSGNRNTKGDSPLEWLARRFADLFPGAHRISRRDLEELCGKFETISAAEDASTERDMKKKILEAQIRRMSVRNTPWRSSQSELDLPALALLPKAEIGLLCARTGDGAWRVETPDGVQIVAELPEGTEFSSIRGPADEDGQSISAISLFKSAIGECRNVFLFAGLATLMANLLALGTSLFSMQVYDRVIPTQGLATLAVLTTGVALAVCLELVLKITRSALLESAIMDVDKHVSHWIFKRLMGVRLDQYPSSVGTLAAQVRSYETIRAFAFAAVLYAIDIPFALLFLVLISALAGPILAGVIMVFLVLAVVVGLMARGKIAAHTRTGTASSNRKVGILVEAVEGAETIKAAGASWIAQLKWNALVCDAMEDDVKVRRHQESTMYMAAAMQQLSYVSLIALGAYIASTQGTITMGGLIACSILSGRVLTPVGMIPSLTVQWAQAKMALENLEHVFSLRGDNDNCDRPLTPERLHGHFEVNEMRFAYEGQTRPLSIDKLSIQQGEKVGILGPVGAGKSTLLKLLGGLYAPRDGHVLLDGLDVQLISRQHMSEQCGYLPQDTRLFAGTLRENLLLGVPHRSEEEIIAAVTATGLMSLISAHPRGLDIPIAEGGNGVSRGQKQLIAFTRLLLARPQIWLLDEPTASMDEATERKCLAALRQLVKRDQTLVLVTHKPALLSLVQRLVVISSQGIVLDGPSAEVIARLRGEGRQAPAAQPATGAVHRIVEGSMA